MKSPSEALLFKNIEVLIFDLDDTLLDTTHQLVPIALREACQIMIKNGLPVTLEECLTEYGLKNEKHERVDFFSSLAEKFGSLERTEEFADLGRKAFYDRKIKEKIFLEKGTAELLGRLQKKYQMYLVTLGVPSTQKQKVELLNISSYFLKIEYVDLEKEKTKSLSFQKILKHSKVRPDQVLCIGNRIDSEIRDGKALGMNTLLVKQGEHTHLQVADAFEKPDHSVENLTEIEALLL